MQRWLPNAVAAATLVVLAFASGFAWRAELEWQGWEGLGWIHRTHLAFPIALGAFVAWAAAVAAFGHGTRGRRLAVLVGLLSAIAVAGFLAIPRALLAAFGGFDGGLISMELAAAPQHLPDVPKFLSSAEAGRVLLRDLLFWTVWLLPTLALWGVLRATAIRAPLWSVPLSALVQFWAWPVSVWLLAILGDKGTPDTEHALKSGFVIPWLVIAVGIPLVAAPPPATPATWDP